MRDIDRIDNLLDNIRELWWRSPDLRLCQLLSSIADKADWNSVDLFYLEDDVLNKQIIKELEEIRRG